MEGGNLIGLRALSGFEGEAYVETSAGARARTMRIFDLSFALEWQVAWRMVAWRMVAWDE